MEIICTDRMSVGLYCDVNFEWHMPICAGICHAEQKYVPLKHWNIYQYKCLGTNDATLRSGFSRKLRSVICVLDFYPGFTDKG